VDQTKVVLPTELEDLAIVEGEDYCTLLTCTPYGVNTHRLLVRGHRVDGAAGSLLQVPSDAYRLSPWIGVVLVGVPLLLLCLLAYGLWRRKRG
jgi:sortase A